MQLSLSPNQIINPTEIVLSSSKDKVFPINMFINSSYAFYLHISTIGSSSDVFGPMELHVGCTENPLTLCPIEDDEN